MPFTRTNGIKDAADLCDKYVAPASCNTANPPSIYDLGPKHFELATTGLNESFTTVALLIAAALAVAGLALFIVIALHQRRDSNKQLPSQVACSSHDENHWPQVVHHDRFIYYPDAEDIRVVLAARMAGKNRPIVYKGSYNYYYVVDPLKPNQYNDAHRSWADAVAKVEEIFRGR